MLSGTLPPHGLLFREKAAAAMRHPGRSLARGLRHTSGGDAPRPVLRKDEPVSGLGTFLLAVQTFAGGLGWRA